MCGIVGIFDRTEALTSVVEMLDLIKHRGPDASGTYRSNYGGVAFVHRRLSIIDLSEAANQPFVKDGLVITYNGEIYNYKALSRELATSGVKFSTTSDSEVFLAAWCHWGPDCLNRLRGMFDFAIFESTLRDLCWPGIHSVSSRCSFRVGS